MMDEKPRLHEKGIVPVREGSHLNATDPTDAQGAAGEKAPRSNEGIVPVREASAAAATAGNLTYNFGRIINAPGVCIFFWGTDWQQAPQDGLIQPLNNFFDFVLTSSLMDVLGEYSVPGQAIGYGHRLGTFTITAFDPGTLNADGSRTVTDAQIQKALGDWLNEVRIVIFGIRVPLYPQPAPDTIYFVYLPPNVTVQSGSQKSCTDFCGYHSAANLSVLGNSYTVPYAVVPFINCAGCVSGTNLPLDSLTEVSSHELCEIITDPEPLTGWNDNSKTNGEIGDLCNFQAVQLGGFNIQQQFSNRAQACVSASQFPPLSRIRFDIGTGNDDLGGGLHGSSATADVLKSDGTALLTVTLRNSTDPVWGGGSMHGVEASIPAGAALTATSCILVRINLVQNNPGWSADNWNISTLKVTLFQPGGSPVCNINLVGNSQLSDGSTGLVRLSLSDPSATFRTNFCPP